MIIMFCLGLFIFIASVVAVNLATNPPAANIGMLCSGVGIFLMVVAGVWKVVAFLN